jgi:hypothetical protein
MQNALKLTCKASAIYPGPRRKGEGKGMVRGCKREGMGEGGREFVLCPRKEKENWGPM